MSAAAAMRRGWCPGALRPMPTGDGLLVRVRVPNGRLTSIAAESLAEAADSCGNGAIDLSARANLQMRGISDSTLADLHRRLDTLGLLDPDGPEAEARRNVLGPPLAGDDPSAAMDVRPYLAEIGAWLATDPRLRSLPPKFAVVVDDGGALRLDGVESDLRFLAVGPDRMAVGMGRADWIAEVPPAAAANAVAVATLAFLSMRGTGPDAPRRMRELDAVKRSAVAKAVARIEGSCPLGRLPDRRRGAGGPSLCAEPAGLFTGVPLGPGRTAVALGLAYGRMDASMLRVLADLARRYGNGTLRLTPWRAVLIPAVEIACADPLRAEAAVLGIVTDSADPRRRIAACVGAAGCASAHMATHALAKPIAPHLPMHLTLHVSGCAKGCAKSGRADIVLVGQAGGAVGLVRNGRAADQPAQIFAEASLLVEWFRAGMQ